jgi:predicted enzyme related to lactoylglutathione lyase
MQMMNSVTHFEIFAEEPTELAEFYRTVLGWQIEKVPGIDYWRIQTNSANGNGINGGLLFRPLPGLRSWLHYVQVSSVDQAVERVLELGGEVVRPKTAVPKTAWVTTVADPQGNIFAIWEADPLAMPMPEPED